jgi:DNA-binding NarL/FixJ family response regulator
MNNKDFTIVIADDHPMLLNGLYEALTSHGYNVISKASNGIEALQLILEHHPTLAILDVEMPYLSGFEVVKKVKEKKGDTKFIMQTLHKTTDYIELALALKIEGYLLKEDSFEEIESCIKTVLANETFFSNSIENSALLNATKEFGKLKILTPSEMVILKLISQQSTTKDIASSLHVSIRTIEKHRSNIIEKLELKGESNSLTLWAIKHTSTILSF